MKALYIVAVSLLAGIAAAVVVYKKRSFFQPKFTNVATKTSGMARSAWGRVANAASNLTHTERDATSPAQS